MNTTDLSWIGLPSQRIIRRRVADFADFDYLIRLAKNPDPSRVLIVVHGISREPETMLRWLAEPADEAGYTMLAPVFDQYRFTDYQRLGRAGHGGRADLAVMAMLSDSGRMFEEHLRPDLLGFSGGAQFGHRFILAHPGTIKSATLVSSGWYTPLDSNSRYPYGLRQDSSLPGVNFDAESLLRTPTLILVGALDTEINRTVRNHDRLNTEQGTNRVERARWFHHEIVRNTQQHDLLTAHRFEVLPGTGHDFAQAVRVGRLADRLFEFIQACEHNPCPALHNDSARALHC